MFILWGLQAHLLHLWEYSGFVNFGLNHFYFHLDWYLYFGRLWSGVCALSVFRTDDCLVLFYIPLQIISNPFLEEASPYWFAFRVLFPWMGVKELEYAIQNMFKEFELFANTTMNITLALQDEINSVAQEVLQNRLALDHILAAHSRVFVYLN